jgi:hypothetical protein
MLELKLGSIDSKFNSTLQAYIFLRCFASIRQQRSAHFHILFFFKSSKVWVYFILIEHLSLDPNLLFEILDLHFFLSYSGLDTVFISSNKIANFCCEPAGWVQTVSAYG